MKMLTGAEGLLWIQTNLHISNSIFVGVGIPTPNVIKETANGYHINGDVILLVPEFKVSIHRISGSLRITPGVKKKVTSLKTFPYSVGGIVDVSRTSITSLEGMPHGTDDIRATDCREIKSIRDVFPNIQRPIKSIDLYGTGINSLVGISDLTNFYVETLLFNWSRRDIKGGLGLICVPRLEKLCDPASKGHPHEPFRIIHKYLGKPDEIFQCQQELIEAGFEEQAQL